MSRLLALDQSSHTTGYAIFENEKFLSCGKFELKDSDLGVRLQKYRNKIQSLIVENHIDEVIFEDIQLQEKIKGQKATDGNTNIKTFKTLAEVFGITYELLTEMKIPNRSVLAITWKSALRIKGTERSEQKKNTQIWVKENYNITPTEDECDAIGIGAYYYIKKEPELDWS